jgi:hypothetical protein
MTFWVPQGRSIYQAMLLEVDKRFSKHFQFQVSYALQNQNAVVSPTLDLDNYFATYGPNLARHNLHVNAMVQLPKGFQLSINQAAISRTPVDPVLVLPLTDPANKFGSSTLVPIQLAAGQVGGGNFNCFGLSCGKSDLKNFVNQYNTAYGKNITLPSHYQFGDPFFDTDFRLSKAFQYKERYRLTIAGEVFNAFNIANLQLAGYNFTLGTPTFGQATTRVIQTFGSGGPRAFQVLARVTF